MNVIKVIGPALSDGAISYIKNDIAIIRLFRPRSEKYMGKSHLIRGLFRGKKVSGK